MAPTPCMHPGIGAIPIPGGKSAAQVTELTGALGWELDENEVAMIDEKCVALGL